MTLIYTAAFWDSLLVLLWILLIGLVALFAFLSAVVPQHSSLSYLAAPVLSACFVLISVSRFLALRMTYPRWLICLATGQVGASIALLWLGVTRPAHSHWALNLVENVLAGSAAAFLLYVFVYLLSRIRRPTPSSHVIEVLKKRAMREQQQRSPQ
jgi:hypothetical protein